MTDGSLHLQEVRLWPGAYPATVELYVKPGDLPVWSGVAQTGESLVELPSRTQLGLPPTAIVGMKMILADGHRLRFLWMPGVGVIGPLSLGRGKL